MTNWPELTHAYGSAEDIPALLARVDVESTSGLWGDLWSALCHQGTVYPASFAALPWLAGVAERGEAEVVQALVLGGAIMAGEGQEHGAGDVRRRYAAEVAVLLRVAGERLSVVAEPDAYVYLLESVLGLEGVPVWGRQLSCLVDEEFQVACPGCGTELFVAVGSRGFFSTPDDYALDDAAVRTPLRPRAAEELTGLGRRLHDTAVAHGHPEVATALRHVFGDATCSACCTAFTVADRVAAGF